MSFGLQEFTFLRLFLCADPHMEICRRRGMRATRRVGENHPYSIAHAKAKEDKEMAQIKVSNLTFAYEGSYDNVFENVSFVIDTDWRLGFTGRNGRGKTTFLKLLLGQFPYQGKITHSSCFDYFPFHTGDKTRNGIDIVDEIYPDYDYWKISRELSILKVDDSVLFRPFETLSNGEQTKVMLSVLFSRDNYFLLIDEPTNHLDEEARELVANYLKSKKGFILVSHDRAFLDTCTDHILSINKNNIEIEQGNFSSWMENKSRRDAFEVSENDRLKKEIHKLQETAAEKAKWADKVEKTKYHTRIAGLRVDRGYIGHKSAKMMAKAKAGEARAEKKIAEKSKLLKNIERADDLKITPLEYHSNVYAQLKNVSLFYDNRKICGNVAFDIKRGDRVALKGCNGCGKSSVIKLLLGEKIAYEGEYKVGSGLVISYVSQDTSFLGGNLKDFAVKEGVEESLFKAVLRKLDFSREMFDKDMREYSEGQKKKVLLAKSLCEKAHLYIWDEPLNYIDIFSRMQLENLILKWQPTFLFVEHDKTFCEKTATKVVQVLKENF